jgi:kinesin family protein 1
LMKFIDIWRIESPKSDALLMRSNTATPEPSHVVDENHPDQGPPPALAAQVEHHPKTIAVLKSGWLLSPDHTGTRWVKRFCELRRPYLHLYSSEGDEVAALNLTNSRIDAEPQVAKLLQRDNMRMEVWAVYATNKAWLFAARNDRERGEWIWAVDRSYVLGNGE